MKLTHSALLIGAAGLIWTGSARAAQHAIDTAKSTMTVHVSKAGALSAFGHDHDIAAPIAGGEVDPEAHRVELHLRSASLKVRDTKGSQKDHDEIQKTMSGPEVLDVERHPEIRFKSTSVESAGGESWTVRGELTLHGQTQPVTVTLREQGGHYTGSAQFKQTEFGIKPVKIAGGTVKVKDEVRIQFDIQLAR